MGYSNWLRGGSGKAVESSNVLCEFEPRSHRLDSIRKCAVMVAEWIANPSMQVSLVCAGSSPVTSVIEINFYFV